VLLPLLTTPAALRAQDLPPAPADARAPPAPSTPPAPSATQATAPAEPGQQTRGAPLAQIPVSARPFGMDLINLPVDHLLGDW
jgi:hypothetical protein